MKLSLTFLIILAVECSNSQYKKSSIGEICGGPIDPIQCEDGLECYYLAEADKTLPGICRPTVTTANRFTTTEDYQEFKTPSPRIVGKGEHCGGFIMNAPICSHGLNCVLDIIPDVGGTCQ